MSEQTRLKTGALGAAGISFALDPLAAGPDEFAESPVELTAVGGTGSHRGRTAA